MTEIVPIVPKVLEEGNTNSPKPKKQPSKQESPKNRWRFTVNNWSEEEKKMLIEAFSSNSSNKWIIGEEIGECGTPHLQGFVNFEDKIRFTAFKKICPRANLGVVKGTDEQNFTYCSKDGKYVCSKNVKIKKPLKIIKEEDFKDWQKDIIKIVESEPDNRSIYWFWEEKGGIGKTQFCKYLSHVYNAVPIEGKKNDILFCAATFDSDIYLFDLERSMEEYVSYAAIEKIKNGYYMCSKYESKPIIRNCPHVIIFANFKPEVNKLSLDRWKIVNLK